MKSSYLKLAKLSQKPDTYRSRFDVIMSFDKFDFKQCPRKMCVL